MYYNDVQGVLVCFDLTDEESFKRLDFWLEDLRRHAPENIVKILCGCKSDLVSLDLNDSVASSDYNSRRDNSMYRLRRQVTGEDAVKFASRNKMYYMEVSAKTGHNVSETFFKMATEVNELWRKKQIEQQMKQST